MVDATALVDYENDALSPREEVELFSALVADGTVWVLQGHYGRTARALIDQGLLYEDGTISAYAEDLLADLEAENPYA